MIGLIAIVKLFQVYVLDLATVKAYTQYLKITKYNLSLNSSDINA